MTPERGIELRDALADAQQTGLVPRNFDPQVVEYLQVAERASDHGYIAAFLAVSVLALIGAVTSAWLVRRPAGPAPEDAEAAVPETAWGADTPEPDAHERHRHPVRPVRIPARAARTPPIPD